MTSELAPSDLFDESAFWLLRGTGTVKITPCPDGASDWHWTYIHTVPLTKLMPTGDAMVTEQGIVPVMREVETEPDTFHSDTESLLSCLSYEEARLFVGYCAHLHEHLLAELGGCVAALQEAFEQRRLGAIETLATKVLMADHVRNTVAKAAQRSFDVT